MRLNCHILAFLLQKKIRETTDEDSDESDTEDSRKVSIMFIYKNSALTKLVDNILGPTVFSKNWRDFHESTQWNKSAQMCFLLIHQGEVLSSNNLIKLETYSL